MSPRALVAALAALAALAAGLTAAPSAHAVTGSPPVTAPDTVVAYPGNVALVEPLDNDFDPDGDDLAVCRLSDTPRGISAEVVWGDVGLYVRGRVRPGTYTLTYHACDFSYLVPGTITVVVRALPEPKVQKIADRPGRLRVTNRADFAIQFLYGDPGEEEPDDVVRVRRGETVVVRVDRTRIYWIAFAPRRGILVGRGRVDGIELRRGDRRPTSASDVSGRLLDTWRRS